jgi:hypothetical protein
MCEQVRRYLDLKQRYGPAQARELALDGLPERQVARMGPLIDHDGLATGMAKAVPGLAAIGISTEFVDVSTQTEDAALEVMLTCPCLVAAQRLGLAEAEPMVCELDLAATERAFPDLTINILARQTDRSKVCVFRFSRPRRDITTDEEQEKK